MRISSKAVGCNLNEKILLDGIEFDNEDDCIYEDSVNIMQLIKIAKFDLGMKSSSNIETFLLEVVQHILQELQITSPFEDFEVFKDAVEYSLKTGKLSYDNFTKEIKLESKPGIFEVIEEPELNQNILKEEAITVLEETGSSSENLECLSILEEENEQRYESESESFSLFSEISSQLKTSTNELKKSLQQVSSDRELTINEGMEELKTQSDILTKLQVRSSETLGKVEKMTTILEISTKDQRDMMLDLMSNAHTLEKETKLELVGKDLAEKAQFVMKNLDTYPKGAIVLALKKVIKKAYQDNSNGLEALIEEFFKEV